MHINTEFLYDDHTISTYAAYCPAPTWPSVRTVPTMNILTYLPYVDNKDKVEADQQVVCGCYWLQPSTVWHPAWQPWHSSLATQSPYPHTHIYIPTVKVGSWSPVYVNTTRDENNTATINTTMNKENSETTHTTECWYLISEICITHVTMQKPKNTCTTV